MKVQLINAVDSSSALLNDQWLMPLNLLSLATYLRIYLPETEVEIIDGFHVSSNDILQRIDGDVVGINFNMFSTGVMDRIAEHSKERGSLVVVGGHAATPLSKQILAGNGNVDIVVRYDGEEALRQITERQMSSGRFEGIPNIVYRTPDGITEGPINYLDIRDLPVTGRNLGGIKLEDYSSFAPGYPLVRATNTYTKKGCNRSCHFCGRMYKTLRSRTPKQAFEEYSALAESGINRIFEMSDTFFSDKDWLDKFVSVYEAGGGLPASFWAFCDIRDIDRRTVELMKFLNFDMVCAGIESGNEHIRKDNGKSFTNQQIFEAAELLGSNGISLQDSYILGQPGESEKTVRETYEVAQKVGELCKVHERGYSMILPLPGSPNWGKMMGVPELAIKYGNKYKFDVEELRKDFITHFCDFN
jgi:radical SAM superfamily enzyme YgiQ (UPF0313 family)